MWPEPRSPYKVSQRRALFPLICRRATAFWGLTLFDLAVEVDGIHGDGDDVGVAVASGHDARHLVHQLHGYTCRTHTSIQDQPAASGMC